MSRLLSLLLVVSLVGCGMVDLTSPRKRNRQLTHPGMPQLAPGEIPEGSPRRIANRDASVTLDTLPADMPGLVVLVMVDALRADRMHLCGGVAPNTPELDALRDGGAQVSCGGVSASTWALPALTSLLTGVTPAEHGALALGLDLPDTVPTLAEQMAASGYQTMLISGNPLLQPHSSYVRGFHRVSAAAGAVGPDFRGEGFARHLRYEIAQIDPKRPLFLVLDLFDAHAPYAAVPRGLDWTSVQASVNPYGDDAEVAARFVADKIGRAERERFQARVLATYDHSVFLADRTVGTLTRVIARQEMSTHGLRLVVVGAYGQLLGERGRLWHGGPPWEPVTRVPLVYMESNAVAATTPTAPVAPAVVDTDGVDSDAPAAVVAAPRPPVVLPPTVSTLVVSSLVRHGRLPDPLPPATSAVIPAGSVTDEAVAVWLDGVKLMRHAGQSLRYDLTRDPGETAGAPITDPAEQTALDVAVAAAEAARDAVTGRKLDAVAAREAAQRGGE